MVNIVGTSGADVFAGTLDDDIFNGLGGADRIIGDAGADMLDGGDGDDVVSSNGPILRDVALFFDPGLEIDHVSGGNDNDLVGGGYGDIIDGGAGADTIVLDLSAATGAIAIDFRFASTNAIITGPGAIANVETYFSIYLGDFDDSIDLWAIRSTFGLGRGVYAGNGNDIVTGSNSSDAIYGGGGNDILFGGAVSIGTDFLSGGDGNDLLIGSASFRDVLNGDAGDDYFDMSRYTGSMNKRIDGGADFDVVKLAGNRADYKIVPIGNGRFLVEGLVRNFYEVWSVEQLVFDDMDLATNTLANFSIIQGTELDDVIGPGTSPAGQPLITQYGDEINGGGGNDFLDGGAGADKLKGGTGADTFVFDGVDILEDYSPAENDLIRSSASISGFVGRIELIGTADIDATASANFLFSANFTGNDGANVLTGNSLNDLLSGQGGDDTLVGGLGDDVMDGGAGVDTASYADASGTVVVDLSRSGIQQTQAGGKDQLLNIENLVGSDFSDRLLGSAANNVIEGGNGDDYISGRTGFDTASYAHAQAGVTVSLALTVFQDTTGAGSDRLIAIEALIGSVHDDSLTGNSARNTLDGGDGNDRLVGGGGADLLIGGTGADAFAFIAPGQTTKLAFDTIADFHGSDGDRIDLSAIDANTRVSGNQSFDYVTAFSKAAGQLISVELTPGQWFVQGDVNGDAKADFAIYVANAVAPLGAADFIL